MRREAFESLPLRPLRRSVATLRYGLIAERYAEIAQDPRLLNLEEGFIYTLQLLAKSSYLAPGGYSDDTLAVLAEYEALLTELRALGIEVPAYQPAEAERYVRFRCATDRYVAA